jgi:Tol biopolymer transport system component
MRAAWAVALLLPLPAVGPVSTTEAARTPRQPRILFSSALVSSAFGAGEEKAYARPDIYSLSAAGRLAQLTFTGGDEPVPSPDGRLIVFSRDGNLWLMSADGRRQRLLVTHAGEPAWTPNSRRLAYVATDAQGQTLGIRVIRADGTGRTSLARGPVTGPAWSPDGHSLAFVRATSAQPATDVVSVLRAGRERFVATASRATSLSWSSDGRRLAFADCDGTCAIFVAHPNVSGRRFVSAGSSSSWSPHGPRLAYIDDRSIRTFDYATGARRALVTYDQYPGPSSIAWAPDGTKIAYGLFNDEADVTQLETVSLRGRVQRLGAYPDAAGFVWTTPTTGLRYRAPQGAGPIALGDELRFRLPVDELAADGDAVAYRTCGGIGIWRRSGERVTAVRPELPLCNFQDNYIQYYSLALAGDQVAWGEVEGGNVQGSLLFAARVGANAPAELLATGPGITNGPRTTARIGYVMGAGPLVVFSSWIYCDDVYPSSCLSIPFLQRPILSQTLWRLRESAWTGGCPGAPHATPRCQQLRVEPGPLRPLDVDAGRIVVSGDNATLVLGQDGQQLLSLPVPTLAAQLTGSDLVLLALGALRDYDAITGSLLHTWPLPDVSVGGFCGVPAWACGSPRLRLEGAARGLVAYLLDGKLHLLRLRDGADTVVADASAAQLDDDGLFYAYRTTGVWPGRVRFVPFDELPLR